MNINLGKCSQEIREQMRKILIKDVSITSDCWTSKSNESYMGVTIQLIDLNWKPIHFVVTYEHYSETHTATDFHNKLISILTANNLSFNNIVMCVTDNEPTNNCAADTLPFLG
jgi:hypothetical protein